MKYISVCLFTAFCFFSGCKSSKPVSMVTVSTVNEQQADSYYHTEVKYSDQSTWLLGYFNPGQLSSLPHSEWYLKGYDNYQPHQESVNKLVAIDNAGISIKIVMGTWCPDSRREVPRFMKILSQWQFPSSEVTFIGVDNQKLSPVGEYESLGIQRVPTFIVYKNKIEAGRIIENPVTSLEQDMVNILTGIGK
jgi:thiol-disulfide isomerase/thioredoxin